jgi:hypothetical protein
MHLYCALWRLAATIGLGSGEEPFMHNKLISRMLTLCVAFAPLASASLILVGPTEVQDIDWGDSTILTLQAHGRSTSETGCVSPSASGTTTSGCGFADQNVQGEFSTPTLTAAGIVDAAGLQIVFRASQPAKAPGIQLLELVLSFYDANGDAIDTESLVTPITFNDTKTDDFIFRIDDTHAPLVQSIIEAHGGFDAVRVGLGASAESTGASHGGLERFGLQSADSGGGDAAGGDGGGDAAGGGIGPLAPVPEPAGTLLLGAGLLFLSVVSRKFRSA